MKKLSIFSLGIAIFTMMFGAGDIVFSLHAGKEAGSFIAITLFGFLITAVCVPVLGLLSTILYEGSYHKFLYNLGVVPGAILIFICMLVIGPFGAIPRCLVVSYASMHAIFPSLSLFWYSIGISLLIFVLTFRESRVVSILGRFLGPIKISLLVLIIILGFFSFKWFTPSSLTLSQSFVLGLKDGNYSMNLFGGVFFASLVFEAMRNRMVSDTQTPKSMIRQGVRAGLLGGGLLALIYIGFGVLAAIYSSELKNIPQVELLSVLATKVLGFWGGILANLTVAVACLTTAVALTTVLAEYISVEILKNKIPYIWALLLIILITAGMVNLGFNGIMVVLSPVIGALYPSFIVLS
ncbi:MAG: branched-chain amino acid transport system II carrier protein, partial [Chlamydiota bacterium]